MCAARPLRRRLVKQPEVRQPTATDASAIIDRMKAAVRVSTDGALAAKIGCSNKTISGWRARNAVPFLDCLSVAESAQVTLDWLILGILTRGQVFAGPMKGETAVDVELLAAVVRERKFEIEGDGSTWEDDLRRARQLVAEYQHYARLMNTAALEGVSRNDFIKTLRTLIQPASASKGAKRPRSA